MPKITKEEARAIRKEALELAARAALSLLDGQLSDKELKALVADLAELVAVVVDALTSAEASQLLHQLADEPVDVPKPRKAARLQRKADKAADKASAPDRDASGRFVRPSAGSAG